MSYILCIMLYYTVYSNQTITHWTEYNHYIILYIPCIVLYYVVYSNQTIKHWTEYNHYFRLYIPCVMLYYIYSNQTIKHWTEYNHYFTSYIPCIVLYYVVYSNQTITHWTQYNHYFTSYIPCIMLYYFFIQIKRSCTGLRTTTYMPVITLKCFSNMLPSSGSITVQQHSLVMATCCQNASEWWLSYKSLCTTKCMTVGSEYISNKNLFVSIQTSRQFLYPVG